MQQIYVHGLGQTFSSWNGVVSQLDGLGESICLNLADFLREKEASYSDLYRAFANFCNKCDGMIDLCGLSLGGVLCLNYAIDYPLKVNSLILIATQYKMPKQLLRFQNMLFRFIPHSMFTQMGFSKNDFIQLCKTMLELDFSNSLSKVFCRTLVLCGENDSANRKASIVLADTLANAELRIIKGVGHEINTDAPEILAKELQDFYANKKTVF